MTYPIPCPFSQLKSANPEDRMEAFACFFTKMRDQLHRTAAYLHRDYKLYYAAIESEDLVSETYIQVNKQLPKGLPVSNEQHLLKYMLCTLKNIAIGYYRKLKGFNGARKSLSLSAMLDDDRLESQMVHDIFTYERDQWHEVLNDLEMWETWCDLCSKHLDARELITLQAMMLGMSQTDARIFASLDKSKISRAYDTAQDLLSFAYLNVPPPREPSRPVSVKNRLSGIESDGFVGITMFDIFATIKDSLSGQATQLLYKLLEVKDKEQLDAEYVVMHVMLPIDLTKKTLPNLTFMRRCSDYRDTIKQKDNTINYWTANPIIDKKTKRIDLDVPVNYDATIQSVYKSSITGLNVVEYFYPLFGDNGMIISKQVDSEFGPALIKPRLGTTSAFVFRARPSDVKQES